MNTQTRRILHFSLGPVQGFVRQARRTRDLWAGSFLLSWLSGKAMQSVARQGQIVFPSVCDASGKVTEPLLAAIEDRPEDRHRNPQIGSLPNRFKAEVGPDFNPAEVADSVRTAWQSLAEAVWSQFVAPLAEHGKNTKEIWDRQISGFWEINWVIGDADGDDHKWLDARKNWRDRWPEPEGGDHCTIMHDLQELSGFVRAQHKREQDLFWDRLRDQLGPLDLRLDERLCAVALVKRLFPKLPEESLCRTIGWVPGGNKSTVGNWPSTAYMSAVPWLGGFVEPGERRKKLEKYEEAVLSRAGESVRGERATRIKRLLPLDRLAWLDGNFFIESALANERTTPLAGDPEEQRKRREMLLNDLRELSQKEVAGGRPMPFYAFLLMDGDRVGALLHDCEPHDVSTALRSFTAGVDDTVFEHDGVTLYAGGDDVLAMLPIDRAIECAIALRRDYREAFQHSFGGRFDENRMTASTAVIFAHYHLPHRSVLGEAHHQLDDIAKDKNGRDSLALALLKSSGKSAEWVATWQSTNAKQPPELLLGLVNRIKDGTYSTSFFYNLRARYPMLMDESSQGLGEGLDVAKVFFAEYRKSRDLMEDRVISEDKPSGSQAKDAVTALLAACAPCYRDADRTRLSDTTRLQMRGALLARFLAGGGIER
jgi:CRISPR-associated protein Cmr2